MKKQDRVTLHRERLYAEVWKTPILQLAKKYGMSDVGLAKACRRLDIPLPPRGYWAKQAYGHTAEKQPLPPAKKKNAAKATTLDKSAEELLYMARNRAVGSKVRYTERQRIHRLQNELKDWEMSNRIRAYISAMQASDRITNDQAEFLAWAETYANHLDPTVDFRITVLDEA